MGKYSLVVENSLYNTRKIIDVFDLELQEKRKKVHIKDIDYMTSSFADKDQFLKYLYNHGIIDFYFGNTYIVATYNGLELHYKNIYGKESIAHLASTTKKGIITDTGYSGYQNTVHDFFDLFEDDAFLNTITQTKYMNERLKNMIFRYKEAIKREIFKEEELLERQNLLGDIKKEISRYKTFRGIVLFVEEYQKIKKDIHRDVPVKINKEKKRKFKQKSPEQIEKEIEEYEKMRVMLKGMTDADCYNREYDEFLSEEEYERAYHGRG